VAQLVIESTQYGYDATVNFGLANPDGAPVVLAGTLENLLGRDVTVESAEVDGDSFSVDTPALPVTIAKDESVGVSLSFAPKGSGEKTGTLTIVFAGQNEPFVLNLTGEGNYPPVAYAAVTVTGTEPRPYHGTYIRSGTKTEYLLPNPGLGVPETYLSPSYVLPGTVYTIWAAATDGRMGWVIDDDFVYDGGVNTAYYGYEYSPYALVAPSGDESHFWLPKTGDANGTTVVGEIDAPNGDYAASGQTISAHYLYSDAENDPKGVATFQWLISDSMNGPFTAIDGETGAELIVGASMNMDEKYLAVEVTPVAESGITTGEPAFLGPMGVPLF
jgi:hypothetical protein